HSATRCGHLQSLTDKHYARSEVFWGGFADGRRKSTLCYVNLITIRPIDRYRKYCGGFRQVNYRSQRVSRPENTVHLYSIYL
ncbi:hypothetical protein, partial [Atlantibacter sp.]|uniref:hypothetical protein n=1 Tax=Atlantibacter sp. TaxID=1903473 RepID=UPI0028A7D066